MENETNGTADNRFDTLILASETLRGDVRDEVLREFKGLQKPWAQMNESEQERLIHRAQDIAYRLVKASVEIVAHGGVAHLTSRVEQFTVKPDGIKITLTVGATTENMITLAKNCGPCVLALVDPSKYTGERKKAEPEVVGDLAMPKEPAGITGEQLAATLPLEMPPSTEHHA
jgi:hypothetical protein